MSTFKELAQQVAHGTATVSGAGQPTSVAGQTGRLLRIVNATADAWTRIQNQENSWRWMRREFTGAITQSTAKYTAASFALTRMAEWITEHHTFTLYDTSIGVADEGEILVVDYDVWNRLYNRGQQDENRPVDIAVTPRNELALGPIPNKNYTLRGQYRLTPQILVADDDVPECPPRFHRIIVDRALMIIAESDEAVLQIGSHRDSYANLLRGLMRDQLPRITVGGGPIA